MSWSSRPTGPRVTLTAEVVRLPARPSPPTIVVPFQITPRDDKLRVIYMEGSAAPEISVSSRTPWKKTPISSASRCTVDNQYVARPGSTGSTIPSRGFPTTREELLEL